MTQQESPQQAAQRQLEAEEGQRRQSRLDALTKQEKSRRDQQAREEQAEAQRAEAAKRAEKLGARRSELEAQAEESMNALRSTLDELEGVDEEHRRELHAADALRGAGRYQDLGKVLHGWLRAGLLRDNPVSRAQTLAQLDALTVSEEPESRSPARGIPGSDPKDEPRQRNVRFLEMIHGRAGKMRRDYGRDLQLNELLGDGERETFEALSEEDRERVQAMLTGANG